MRRWREGGRGRPEVPPRKPVVEKPEIGPLPLAEAFVFPQKYNGYVPPGEMVAPGTIFPELVRTPPLYQYPPGTGPGRRGPQ